MKIETAIFGEFLHRAVFILENPVLLDFKKDGLYLVSSSDEDICLVGYLPSGYFAEYEICKGIISDLKFLYSLIKSFPTEKAIEFDLKDEVMIVKIKDVVIDIPLMLERYFKPLKTPEKEPLQIEEFEVMSLKTILKLLRLTKDEIAEIDIKDRTLFASAGKLEKIKVKLDLKKEATPISFKISLSNLFKVVNSLKSLVVAFRFYDKFIEVKDETNVVYTYYLKMLAERKIEINYIVNEQVVKNEEKVENKKEEKIERKIEDEEVEELIEMFRRGNKEKEDVKKEKKEERIEENVEEEEDIW